MKKDQIKQVKTISDVANSSLKTDQAARRFQVDLTFDGPKYNPANAVHELDLIINSLTKAIEKGDNLQLGIVLGQSLNELKKLKQNLLFA